jgi:hypothetical protein
MTASPFFAAQPDRVRAVIEFAAMRQAECDSAHDLVAQWLLDPHAETIREIWRALQWIDRLASCDAVETLRAYHGAPSLRFFGAADVEADRLRGELERDVILRAQLVASLAAVGMVSAYATDGA